MNTRRATMEDLEWVVNYGMAISHQHHGLNPRRFSIFPDHEKLLREYFSFELANRKSIISLLVRDNEITGFSFVTMEDLNLEQMAFPRAWLCDIYVDEKARKEGGGNLLVNASKKAAIELGSQVLMLHVATQNQYAKSFFTKNGFTETMTEMLLPL